MGFFSRGCSDLCGEFMIELVLMAALAGPQQTQPPRSYTPPQPIYTPPPSQGAQNSQPIAPATAPKPLQTPPPAPSGGTWKDKMWDRYKQRTGTN